MNATQQTTATLTRQQFADLFGSIRGATFATIQTRTDARLKKTGNPFGSVFKVSRVNVCLGFHYEAAVNRQRDREGKAADFEAAARQWGQRVGDTVLIENKGKLYLEAKVERALGHSYQTDDGVLLDADQVKPFLPSAGGTSHQGVDREVVVRTYGLDSIESITIDGTTYAIAG